MQCKYRPFSRTTNVCVCVCVTLLRCPAALSGSLSNCSFRNVLRICVGKKKQSPTPKTLDGTQDFFFLLLQPPPPIHIFVAIGGRGKSIRNIIIINNIILLLIINKEYSEKVKRRKIKYSHSNGYLTIYRNTYCTIVKSDFYLWVI